MKLKLQSVRAASEVRALISLGVLGGAILTADAPAQDTLKLTELGAFRPSPALTLYVVNDAEKSAGRLSIRRGPRNEGDRLMVRVFDADEKLTFRQYLEPGQLKDTFGPGYGEIWGIPIAIPDTIVAPNDLLADMTVGLRGKGIHQIRVSAGQINSVVSVALDRPCDFGVSFQNGTYYPWDKAVTAAYVFVPPNAAHLNMRGEGVSVEDETGRKVFPVSDVTDARKSVQIPVSKTGVVWTFRFADTAKWSFVAGGFPVILCNSKATAENIKASLETLPDGTVAAHKFQRRIAELLPSLLAPDKAGSAEELLKLDLFKNRNAWLAEPARNELLLNPYGLFPTLYKELRDGIGQGAALAEAEVFDSPVNPYFGRKELLYRAAAASLRSLMTLPECEAPNGSDMEWYPGVLALQMGADYFTAFRIASAAMPEDVRTVWEEGLAHIVDRHLPDMMISCMNQSSHFLVLWQAFAMGSRDSAYAGLARRYAERFTRNASPAGYFIENCGPDATYCGIQHYYMGLYYLLSRDPLMLEAIRKSYAFFNHTAAPEPDGRALGGFNYAHRTPQGFDAEQYGGARGMLQNVLPEVALWARRPDTPEQNEEARRRLETRFGAPLPESRSPLFFAGYGTWNQARQSATWPAAEAKPFIRDFAGELIAVKRPAYFAAIYTGKPVQDKFYIRLKEVFHRPLPDRAEDACGDAWKLYYTPVHPASPLLGGGLTLFWTPAYGNALLAGNSSPLVHHGLVATDKDGKRWWEDYFQRSHALDAKAGTLKCSGKVEGLPLQYSRAYEFAPDELRVTLTLTADEDLQLSDMVENIPLAGGTPKKNGVEIVVAGEETVSVSPEEKNADKIRLGRGKAADFKVMDKNGAGIEVRLDQARELRICRSGMMSRDLQINRVGIVLPTVFKKGMPLVLAYRLIPKEADAPRKK